MVAAHLADTGGLEQLASLYLGVTVLDQIQEGTVAALADEHAAALAVAASRSRGYLDGRSLAEVFAWLRANDLIWNYWVNNYLEGKTPPPFDILYWNADTTRLPAALHRDFINIALTSALAKPDAVTMLGSPVDLSRVDVDSYLVAAAGQGNPPDPRQWLQAAETVAGSWWPHYSSWLAERSGGEKDRPGQLGDDGFEPMEPAP